MRWASLAKLLIYPLTKSPLRHTHLRGDALCYIGFNQVALLHAKVATLNSQKATLAKTQADYDRAAPLVQSGGVTQEDLDRRKQAMLVAQRLKHFDAVHFRQRIDRACCGGEAPSLREQEAAGFALGG